MVKCTACDGEVLHSQLLKCTNEQCSNNYHYECVGMSRSIFGKIGKGKSSWKCPDRCAKPQSKRIDNSDTPVRNLNTFTTSTSSPTKEDTRERKESDLSAGASDSQSIGECKMITSQSGDDIIPRETAGTQSDMKNLTATLTRMINEFSSLKDKLEEVTNSLAYCHEKMDDLERHVTSNNGRIKELEKMNQEVINLRVTVSLLQGELHMQSQQKLLNEIEIVGIPETSNENLEHIVKIAATKVGVQLEDGDIDWVGRVGARRPPILASENALPSSPRPVVMRLLRRSKRNQLIKAYKSRRNITSSDLQLPGTPIKVYLNERLTKENRILFRETRTRAKK